ncbi:MAG: HAD family hydrolase [Bacteroidetes bacterium]|nr:HAD family hydrolase [Bacteroidota bacterium]
MMDYQNQLRDFIPANQYFIGIDSDGCVFDTMEVKQKEFFIPNALKYFSLFPVAKTVRETWEFVNLYSVHRGNNRFIALLKVFELLAERSEIADAGFILPDLTPLREWSVSETKLGNATLRKHFAITGDKRLEPVLRWSETINREISEWLHDIPPFPNAKRTLEKISSLADILVVSQTPLEALEHEWHANDLKRYVRLIAAQEHGTKAEHLALAATAKYPAEKILMIGDARGDLEAARRNGVLFFPIIPGSEDNSWKMFLDEGIIRFQNGTFRGSYEDHLASMFMESLPETPPWKKHLIP